MTKQLKLWLTLCLLLLTLSPVLAQAQDLTAVAAGQTALAATDLARSNLIGLTVTAQGQATAMPADWNESTPVWWMNQQAEATDYALTPPAPEVTPEPTAAPASAVTVNIEMPPDNPAPVSPETPVSDAYDTALNALIAVLLSIIGGGVAVTSLAIWKFAPIVLAVLEFLAKLTPRTDDDAAIAALRAELERLGLLQGVVTMQAKYGQTIYPDDAKG